MAIETPKQKKLEEVKTKRSKRVSNKLIAIRNKAIIKDLIGGMSIHAVAEKYGMSTYNVYFVRNKSVEYKNESEPPHMSFPEIGKVLGTSSQNARIIYKNAMKKLKVIVVEYDIDLEDFIHQPELWRRE